MDRGFEQDSNDLAFGYEEYLRREDALNEQEDAPLDDDDDDGGEVPRMDRRQLAVDPEGLPLLPQRENPVKIVNKRATRGLRRRQPRRGVYQLVTWGKAEFPYEVRTVEVHKAMQRVVQARVIEKMREARWRDVDVVKWSLCVTNIILSPTTYDLMAFADTVTDAAQAFQAEVALVANPSC